MAPSTRKPAWYRRIVLLAAVLFIGCATAWMTRPAIAQPSYCTPDPNDPVVGCWRSSGWDEFPHGNGFDIFTKDGVWFSFNGNGPLPSSFSNENKVGFWRRSPDVPNEFDTVFSNVTGVTSYASKHFIKRFSFENNRMQTVDLEPSFNPFASGKPGYWERLGGSFSASRDTLSTAAIRLTNAIDGNHFAEAARAFFDFRKKCFAVKECKSEYDKVVTLSPRQDREINAISEMVQFLFVGEEKTIIRFASGPLGRALIRLASQRARPEAPRVAENPFSNGRTPTDGEIESWAEANGWTRVESETGPVKYTDENGVPRVTIKEGSSRTAGSEGPHVELRDETGQRIDAQGNPVSRRSPGNHTPYTKK